MNKFLIIALTVLSMGIVSCNSSSDSSNASSLENELDSVSYSLGVSIGANLERSGLKELNYDLFIAAIKKS